MRPELRVYLDRLRAAAFEVRDFSGIPRWLETHTSDPVDNERPWSFREHEYQMQILSDTCPEITMQKCSQVGASEIWVRMMLAMMAISKKITVIYILPSTKMAGRFSVGRIRPVVEDSDTLKAMIDKHLDNSEQKRIGRSMLYIAGTYGQQSAISVPAQALFRDEVDFCNQRVLTTFDSRLGHSKEGQELIRSFSTPTVFKYGINLLFEAGSQAYYMVGCPACGRKVAIDYFRDVVIPGFEGGLRDLEKDDLLNTAVKIDKAFFLCPECRNVIPHRSFANPANREWVHSFPDRTRHHSYQVLPIDVPAINPLARTLRQLEKYENKKDWVNFKLGLPFEDAQSSFLEEELTKHAQGHHFPRPENQLEKGQTIVALASGCYMGVDVGRTSWVTITKPNTNGGEDVIYQERVRQDGDNYAGRRMVQLFRVFGCVFGVIDAGPDITLAQFMVKQLHGRFLANRYDTRPSGRVSTLDILVKVDEEEGIVTTNRTGLFDALVSQYNRGRSRLTKGSSEYELAKSHLKALKRVETNDPESGDMFVQWVSTGDDHYGHSIAYANVARRLREAPAKEVVVPYLPSVNKVKIRDGQEDRYPGLNITPSGIVF